MYEFVKLLMFIVTPLMFESPSNHQAMWRKVDIDSSGSITREEFARAIDPYVLLVKKEHAERAQLYGSDDGEYSDGSSSD